MKERFALLAAYFKEKLAIGKKSGKEKRKSMILSIVALVEVLAIAVVSVSAWVETISTIKIDLNNGTIDNYVFTNANIGYGDGYDKNTIELTKYFRQAGDVHLASATSANGTDVYFPTLTANGVTGAYRKATVNDKNVNYIDFSFNVTAKKTKASFYFDQVPTFKVNGVEADEKKLRVSFVCEGNSTVVCGMNDSEAEVVAGTSLDSTEQENVKSFDSYTVSTAESSLPLFTVPANSTRKVTMRVWLQDDNRDTQYAGQTVEIDRFKLIAQNPQAGELTFSDKTTGDPSLGAGWATKKDRVIWINQAGKSEYKKLSKDSSGNYFIKLGSEYTDNPNATVTFYSCESSVTANPQKNYVAKWTTTLQAGDEANSQIFTAYGYKDSSNNGYGTWGAVQKILLSSEDTSTLPMKKVDGKYLAVNMYVKDSQTPIAMTFESNEKESLSGWVAYLPNPDSEDANSITFKFTYNGNNYSVDAPNRNSSVNYVITSQSTGYWAPPATVSVYSECTDGKNNNALMGTVSVTGGKVGAKSVRVTKGTTVTLNATSTDSNKYRFIGWFSDPDFKTSVTLSNGNTYTANDTAEHNFYAKFQRLYKVEVKAVSDGVVENSTGGTVKISDGEAGASAVGSYLEGENTTITATQNEGYDFMGWYSDKDSNEPKYTDPKLSIDNIQADQLYYAKFMIKQFSVTAVAKHPNDKKDSTVQFSSPESNAYNTSVTVKVKYNGSATFVAKAGDGYKFVGWYSDENCQTPVVNKNTSYEVSNIKADYKLYAKFEIINLKLNVYSVTDGQTGGAGGTVQLGAGNPDKNIETTVGWGTIATLKAQANANYEFKGWFKDPQCTQQADNSILDNCQYTENTVQTTAIKADTTVYAKFEVKQKRVLYLQISSDWNTPGARYAAYVWNGGTSKWFDLYQEDGDVYKVELKGEAASWSNIIFVKMGANTEGYKFGDAKDQTVDLHPQSDGKNCYKITGIEDGKEAGEWVKYPFDTSTSEKKTYYFIPNDNWKEKDNGVDVRFAAYVHDSNATGNNYEWCSMTYDDALGCYKFTPTLSDGYNQVIFCRMKGSNAENNWNNKLNQTPSSGSGSGYESLPTDGTNCYKLNDGWDNCGGSWTTK